MVHSGLGDFLRHRLSRITPKSINGFTGSPAEAMCPPQPFIAMGMAPDLFRRLLPLALLTAALPAGATDLPQSTETITPPLKLATAMGMPQSDHALQIKSIVLRGVKDYPGLGLRRADLEALVESRRAENEDGFTLDELRDISKEITQRYRRAGLMLAQAVIPEQTVVDGAVTIQVLEGTLERVVTEGNRRYADTRLETPFKALVGQPVQKDRVEAALLSLNDFPGLETSGIFTPGEKVGTTDLILKVRRERRVEAGVWLDNYGTQYTGKERARLNVRVDNPSGMADQVSLDVLAKNSDKQNLFGALNYRHALGAHPKLPWRASGDAFGIGISRSDFAMGGDLADLKIAGVSLAASGYVERHFIRSRRLNLYGHLDFSRMSSTVDSSDDRLGQDELSVFGMEVGADGTERRIRGNTQAVLRFDQGVAGVLGAMEENDPQASRQGGSDDHTGAGDHAGGNFTKVSLRLSQLVAFNRYVSLLARVEGQASNDLLTSFEQMSLGGPNNVRAYAPSTNLIDSGLFGTVEVSLNAAPVVNRKVHIGDIVQASVFLDLAKGELNEPLPNEAKRVTLKGAGIAVQYQRSRASGFNARVDAAAPIDGEDNKPVFYLSLGYRY